MFGNSRISVKYLQYYSKLKINGCKSHLVRADNKRLCLRNLSSKKDIDDTPPVNKLNNEQKINSKQSSLANNSSSWTKSVQEKYNLYKDEDSQIILDDLEEKQLQEETEKEELITPAEDDAFYGMDLTRGVEGVFDIHVLVEVLKAEKAKDICVVKVPREMKYTDYVVIASGFSSKHILATAAFVKKLYKLKRAEDDPFAQVEGKASKNWVAMDMGNIVLHIFLPEERINYDLESLWSIGPEYDDLSQKKEDKLMDKFEEHLKFLESQQPSR